MDSFICDTCLGFERFLACRWLSRRTRALLQKEYRQHQAAVHPLLLAIEAGMRERQGIMDMEVSN